MAAELRLRPLQGGDLPAAHRLSQAAAWPHRIEDWRLLYELGAGVVACDASGEVIGTAMAWRYGDEAATVGMVLVAAEWQGNGIGRRMMDAVLAGLSSCRLMLNSTGAGLRLYEAMGFRERGRVHQLQGAFKPVAQSGAVRSLVAGDRAAVFALDEAAFGAPRLALLDRLLQEGQGVVLDDAARVSGFAIRRRFGRGTVVGPVVARSEEDAIRLVGALAEAGFVRLDIPHDATRLEAWLIERGLAPAGTVTVMVSGTWPPPSPEAMRFGLVSQALG
jgi:predicted N-acetyltransferase YhbS